MRSRLTWPGYRILCDACKDVSGPTSDNSSFTPDHISCLMQTVVDKSREFDPGNEAGHLLDRSVYAGH